MIILSFIIGVFFWTFTEYMLHRFLGHVHKGKNFFKKEHVQHHAKFNYFAPVYKKVISAVILFFVLLFVGSFILPIPIVISFLSGFLMMYAMYENTHFRYHAKEPVAAPFIILRKHHFYHHFHNPKTNHGVTTRFWDRVFGTFVRVEQVNVPQQMSMNWLVEENEVKLQYATHFNLVGKRNPK